LSTGRPASESELGIPLGNPEKPSGYTSKYIDVDFTPEYPFGFGLGYTRFEYSNLRLSASEMQKGGSVTVTADISNRGAREGVETVQLYTHQMTASIVQPVRKLRAFRRAALKPGETRSVSFTLSSADLAFYNARRELTTEPGRVRIWIAPDAAHGLSGEIEAR
jgi:beta-glucosidase